MRWHDTAMPGSGRIAGLDFETTGLDPRQDRVVSVGVCIMESGCVTDLWETLVRPGRPVPRAASRVHGITDARLEEAQRWVEVEPSVSAATEGCLVAAHRMPFDAAFWAHENQRAGMGPPARAGVCTKLLAAAAGLRRHETGLKTACAIMGVDPRAAMPAEGRGSASRWHQAGHDAAAAALLAALLLSDSGPLGGDANARRRHDRLAVSGGRRLRALMGARDWEIAIYQNAAGGQPQT